MINTLTKTRTGRFAVGGLILLLMAAAIVFSCQYLFTACFSANPRFMIREENLEVKLSGADYYSRLPNAYPLLNENLETEKNKIWNAVVTNALGNEGIAHVNTTRAVNLFAVDYAVLRSAISKFSTIQAAEIEYTLPNRLLVKITPRTPVALLPGGAYVCDAEGMVMERNYKEIPKDDSLPKLVGLQRKAFRSGVSIREEVRAALQLIYSVTENRDLGIRIYKINMRDPDRQGVMSMICYYRPNDLSAERIYLVELPTDSRLASKLEELVTILRNLHRAESRYNYLRLIFDGPAVQGRVPEEEIRAL